jgi:hypothetical protein
VYLYWHLQVLSFPQAAENALAGATFDASLSTLTSSLAVADTVKKSLEDINNDPPQIKFSQELSVLLSYDGKPHFQTVENSPFERALNTPLAVVRDTRNKQYFLTSGNLWYQAGDALGPWQPTTNPPSDLVAMIPKSDEPVPLVIPSIVVATEATELIVSTGKPSWTSLGGGKLLYVQNTETPWIRDLASGNMYIQLSGRWFRGASDQGPWSFVRADKLPQAFKEIPPASEIGGVRTSVAGTEEADEAVANAQIPQTTAIKRDQASLSVEYDGKPDFEGIKGTEVAYAVNTAAQVLRIDGQFYAVDNGVWFVSQAATGPWVVADTIPSDEIAKIPPSSPVYNTTYVTVYDSTSDVVYVGYTPGYMWSYPYYGVPIYGTGYYPGRCCGGRYGGGYRHNDININTGDINIGNNVSVGNRKKIENNFADRAGKANIYNSDNNRLRNADRSTAKANMKTARSSSNRKNDLYASKNGQAARRDADQWQVRDNDKWNNVAPEKKPSRESVHSRDMPQRNISKPSNVSRLTSQREFSHSSMNRDFSARSRGSRGGGGGRMRR